MAVRSEPGDWRTGAAADAEFGSTGGLRRLGTGAKRDDVVIVVLVGPKLEERVGVGGGNMDSSRVRPAGSLYCWETPLAPLAPRGSV